MEIAWAGSTCLEGSNPSLSADRGTAPASFPPVIRPLIGLCAAVEDVSYRVWNEAAVMLPHAYADALSRADGIAALLPPDDALAERPAEVVDRLDGVLLAGGSDIDPLTYGATAHPTVTETDPARDRFELGLAHEALERDLPVLGVCRGMQLLNVAAGGTLVQHLPEALGSDRHRERPGIFSGHEVSLAAGSLVVEAVGAERTPVQSHHHQGVAELGEGVSTTGWSVPDAVIEAIELPGRRFALGVLWHPEVDERSRVIEAFVRAARSSPAALPMAHAPHPAGPH